MTTIVVIGGGYAGLNAVKSLAKRTSADITLVNAHPDFVERIRLHQFAAGQQLRPSPLAESLRGTGVELVVGRVTAIDPARKEIDVDGRAIPYDTLVYALGSVADDHGVPGVAENALTVAGLADAARVRDLVPAKGTVTVVGGGLTAIEAATELAESHPNLHVRMVAGHAPGSRLSANARQHLDRVFRRLRIEVRTGARVAKVLADSVVLTDGDEPATDLTIWATGFRVPTLAADSGIETDHGGRIVVDRTQRSVSHPDIYAVGDSAVARIDGQELRMACATAGPMALYAAGAIATRLKGEEPKPFAYRYYLQCISLGRKDALVQLVDAMDRPKRTVFTGRFAVVVKESIVRGARWYAYR
ncbi:NAD(P)/FAD-dependent oxidoreductase [Kutzneria buriramensis]|uniref:NADH dehydrogenase FAD-containing subunit n=1 Tax=Kutzneria buriramensis TaxID=1045776 RepID=A0A3E0IB11_9PSEU|nr:FAD-dependent oxidoreductase [Kutzneria buriramensis]REH55923.1 NADH dehydrogenase FAD-containing subunit [Kutzneria buriramensis]